MLAKRSAVDSGRSIAPNVTPRRIFSRFSPRRVPVKLQSRQLGDCLSRSYGLGGVSVRIAALMRRGVPGAAVTHRDLQRDVERIGTTHLVAYQRLQLLSL